MPLGAFRINSLAKFTVMAVGEVIRAKKSVQALGNSVISTAQSQFGGSSALFAGADIQTESTQYAFGNNNFTIECWVRFTGSLDNKGVFHLANSFLPANTTGLAVAIRNTGWHIFANGELSTGVTAVLNTWYHVALVRIGTAHTLYINGVVAGTRTVTANYTTTRLSIGAYWNYSFVMAGNVDEFRISNTARYTANFTPNTTPFVNDENTLLLLHMDGTNNSTVFEDDNGVRARSTPFHIGAVSISTAQSVFGGSSALINAASGSNNALQFGGFQRFESFNRYKWGDFTNYTIESWVRFSSWRAAANDTGEGAGVLCGFARESGFVDWSFGFNRTGKITLSYSTTGGYGNITLQESGTSGSLNTWHHVAFVKSGTTLTLYVDGVSRATGTLSGTVTYNSSEWFKIGQLTNGAFSFHADEFRISNTARYTGNFTPSTVPFVNDANTLLLLHMDGTNNSTYFEDDNGVRAKQSIVAVNNARLSTVQSRFGGTSALFDTNFARLNVNPSSQFELTTTSTRTIECWIYTSDRPSSAHIMSKYSLNSPFNGWGLRIDQTNTRLSFWDGTEWRLFNDNTLTINTWHHVAIVITNGNVKMYFNGNQQNTTFNLPSSVVNTTDNFGISGRTDASNRFSGYIDEVRVSNTARYTANFTPSTTPFQNDSNTLLLLHMDGTNNSTVFTDDNGVAPDHDYGA